MKFILTIKIACWILTFKEYYIIVDTQCASHFNKNFYIPERKDDDEEEEEEKKRNRMHVPQMQIKKNVSEF